MPCIIAWTAIGIAGVAVSALVGEVTGVGVKTMVVAVTEGGRGVSLGGPGGSDDAVADTAGVGVGGRGAGVAVRFENRPKTRSAAASAPESRESSTDPRACTMYLRRSR